jgi:site-specific DNA recombinase
LVQVNLDELDAQTVGQQLRQEIASQDRARAETVRRTTARLAKLDAERSKLIQMAYADAIPLDLLKSEQDRIKRERELAESDLELAQSGGVQVEQTYWQAEALMRRAAAVYSLAIPDERRLLIRAFLSRLEIDIQDEQLALASPWREIAAAVSDQTPAMSPVSSLSTGRVQYQRRQGPGRPAVKGRSTTNAGRLSRGQGSNMNTLVELRGLEPLTPSMPWRCATNCATAPCQPAQPG